MNYKHGYTKKSERYKDNPRWRAHHCWSRMRQRCLNPSSPDYINYGGRGIEVDPAWDDFEQFVSDMGEPEPGMSLDRIDVNGSYSAANCRWADRKTQSLNRRNARIIEYGGRAMRIAEWAEHLKVPVTTVKSRVYRGKSPVGANILTVA